jgi:hypothetical protein
MIVRTLEKEREEQEKERKEVERLLEAKVK